MHTKLDLPLPDDLNGPSANSVVARTEWPSRSHVSDGASEATADAWIAAWEAKAAQDGLERGSVYWHAGWDWIAAQRERRARP